MSSAKASGNYCWISDDLQLIRNASGHRIEIIGAQAAE